MPAPVPPQPPRRLLEVRYLKPREHLPRMLELEQAAAADRTRIYDGVAWGSDAFKSYLLKGNGLVALSPEKNVIGFACYHLTVTGLEVPKLVARTNEAEDSLLYELSGVMQKMNKQYLVLPLILHFIA